MHGALSAPKSLLVLIVGPDRNPVDPIVTRLVSAGYHTARAETVRAAWRCVIQEQPFAIVVDAQHPHSTWHPFDLCRELADCPGMLTILLVSKDCPHERANAFRCGADQCFATDQESIKGLVAYLEARRTGRDRGLAAGTHKGPLADRAIVIDWENRQIRRGGRCSVLSNKESLLLDLLICHHGSLVTYDEIHRRLWKKRSRSLCAGNLKQIVFRLRRKIEANPRRPKHLLTVRGLGYRILLTPGS